MVYEPPFDRTTAIDNLCMEIAEMVGSILPSSELSTNPVLHRRLRIRTIHSSLLIEGNSLSEDEVVAVLDGKRVLGRERDILEVKNAQRAYDMLGELEPLSLDDLLRAHSVMMEGLADDAGRFRSKNVGVFDGDMLIHAGTPADYVPEVMAHLFGWMRATKLHPLLVSCIFHYEFEFVHPFSDGNGRTGRLWQTLMMSRWRPVLAWLPIETVIRDRQSGYYAVLEQSNAAGSCDAFVEFMLEVVRDALVPYAAGGSSKADDERRVLDYFQENPAGTISGLSAMLGIIQHSAFIICETREYACTIETRLDGSGCTPGELKENDRCYIGVFAQFNEKVALVFRTCDTRVAKSGAISRVPEGNVKRNRCSGGAAFLHNGKAPFIQLQRRLESPCQARITRDFKGDFQARVPGVCKWKKSIGLRRAFPLSVKWMNGQRRQKGEL